jgi:hypothetical protein
VIEARAFSEADAPAWDAFCAASHTATLLHTRRFLSYHGTRFADRSLVLEADGRWLGLLPAALDPAEPRRVVSHPGITYGGLVHHGALRGERAIEALQAAAAHYAAQGLRQLQYKAVPYIYQAAPAQDDLYALGRMGARRVRCDLSSAIELAHPLPVSERRRRTLKKAQRAGLRRACGIAQAGAIQPVHSLAEITLLAERFPQQIEFHAAWSGEAVLAGLVLFHAGPAVHVQYSAASPAGQECGALDLLLDAAIADARARGARHFAFGVSTEDAGRRLNDGLHRFKCEFGAGGVVHEFHEIDLC